MSRSRQRWSSLLESPNFKAYGSVLTPTILAPGRRLALFAPPPSLMLLSGALWSWKPLTHCWTAGPIASRL